MKIASTRASLHRCVTVVALLLSLLGYCRAAVLDNASISISGSPNTAGLLGQVFSFPQPSEVGAEPTLSLTASASPNFTATGFSILQSTLNQAVPESTGNSSVNFSPPVDGPLFAAYGSTLLRTVVSRWSGYIDLPAGVTTFATRSDDGSVLYIDGVRVVNNNLDQNYTGRIGQTPNFATAGQHEIVIAFYAHEVGGIEALYAPGVAAVGIADPALVSIPVVAAGTGEQVLIGVQNTTLAPSDGVLTFTTPNSVGSVDFSHALQVKMTTLTLAGGNTLQLGGAAVRFDSTRFIGGGVNVVDVSTSSAFNQDVAFGQLTDGGVGVRVQKTGPGQLVLDHTSSPNEMSAGSIVEIRGGGLVLAGSAGGENPLGAAKIVLGSTFPASLPGGVTVSPSTLSLTSKGGRAIFDNAVDVISSNTIIAQRLGVIPNSGIISALAPGSSAGIPDPPTTVENAVTTLGGPGRPVSIASGETVTFATKNGYTLELAGGVIGAGNVAFEPGSYVLTSQLTNTGTVTNSTTQTTFFTYDANNALNNRLLAVGGSASQISIGANVSSTGGDSFSLGSSNSLTAPGNIFSVANSSVAALFTQGGNLNAPLGSIIAEATPGGANAVKDLGNSSSLFFGIGGTLADDMTVSIRPGMTPWRGIAPDRSDRTMSGGTITALTDFQFVNVNNASLRLDGVTIATPNGPVVASATMGSGTLGVGRLAFPPGNGLTFALRTGRMELNGAQALGSSVDAGSNAQIVIHRRATLDPNGPGAISGNVRLLSGATLVLNEADSLGGIGSITSEADSVVLLTDTHALRNSTATQNLSRLSPGVVYQLVTDFDSSLPSVTNPAGNFEVFGDRSATIRLSADPSVRDGFVSGALVNDFFSRNFTGSVTIGSGGGTFAASRATNFSIDAPVTVSSGGGRSLTIGTTRLIDFTRGIGLRTGVITLASAANHWGEGPDALAELKITGRATLTNAAAAGVGALPQGQSLAVKLGGSFIVRGGSGGGASRIELGQLTPLGGRIVLDRNDVTPDALTVALNSAIFRSSISGPGSRGSVVFQVDQGQALGAQDKFVFAAGIDPPQRVMGLTASLQMVAPWMIGSDASPSDGTTTTFLDVDPSTATSVGFQPVVYTAMPRSGGSGNEIADNAVAASLTGPVTIAALRTRASVSGGSLNLSTGGLIIAGLSTTSSALNFGGAEAVITSVGSSNALTGVISGNGGLTKLGTGVLALSNSGSTLTGGITINEGVLRAGNANGIPQNNVVTVNPGGVLDVGVFGQTIRGLQGEGLLLNGGQTLTLNTVDPGDRIEFTGSILSSTPMGLRKNGPGTQILSGTLEYGGSTEVVAGTLVVNGHSIQPSQYTVRAGATLAGHGTITGSISLISNGTLSPGGVTAGTAIASLGIGNLSFTEGNFSFDLNGSAAGTRISGSSGYDQLDVTGTISLFTSSNLQLRLNYIPIPGDRLFIMSNDEVDFISSIFTRLNGSSDSLTEGRIFTLISSIDSQSYPFQISYRGEYLAGNLNVGNDLVLVAVPEPANVALLATAAALSSQYRPRRRLSSGRP